MLEFPWLRRAKRSSSARRQRALKKVIRSAQLERLDSRILLTASTPTNFEQYMLQLINAARANPAAYAAGTTPLGQNLSTPIDLNEGLAPGTISSAAKQPLAFNGFLIDSAQGHSQWMLDNDLFQHAGPGGNSPGDRMAASGFSFSGTSGWGENIGWTGTTGTPDVTADTKSIEEDLFIDSSVAGRGHRLNLMDNTFNQIGVGVKTGVFASGGTNWNAVMITQDFAYSGTSVFLTGVAYNDTNSNNFYTPGEGLGSVSIVATRISDNATFSTTTWSSGGYSLALPAGTYNVTASGTGFSSPVTHNNIVISSLNVESDFNPGVGPVSSTTTLSAINPSVFGQNVTFTATVTSTTTPTGVVVFLDGASTLGTAVIASNVATFSTSTASVGAHTITASYLGANGVAASVSSAKTLTVNKANSLATLTAPPTGVFGQAVTLSATVASVAPGTGTPTGTITFNDNGVSIGTGVIAFGQATFSISSLSVGSHTLTATFVGNSNYNANTSTASNLIVSLGAGASTIAITTSLSPAQPGQAITFTAAVNGLLGTPTGTVTFYDGSTSFASSALVLSGFTSVTISTFAAGAHSISAVYSGDINYASSTSATLVQSIVSSTTTALSFSAQSALAASTITLSATVTSNALIPTGTVIFMEGTTTLGSGSLNGTGSTTAVAKVTISSLSIGQHTITASYAGASNFNPSNATVQTLLIGTAHQRYVAQLYRDLLGREADSGGLSSWTTQLDGGRTYAQVAISITSSREYDGIIVDSFYVTYLGRHAETFGLNAWVDQMQSGLNAEVIRAGILGSDEYYNRTGPGNTGGTDTTFITALYQQFLNRAPDGGGLAGWLALLGGNPANRQTVAKGISNSDENRTVIITAFYTHYLHRTPDAGGLAFWKSQLAGGISQPQIISSFVTSTEYLGFYQIA